MDKRIQRKNGKLVITHIIKEDFNSDEKLALPTNTIEEKADHLFHDFGNPLAILEGLKRVLPEAKQDTANKNLFKAINDFEHDIDIALDAYNRGELGFVACEMFYLGRTMEHLNLLPALSATASNGKRNQKAYDEGLGKHRDFHNRNLSNLPEQALELLNDDPSLTIGKISSELGDSLGYTARTISSRLKEAHKTTPFLPKSCFTKGRPKKPEKEEKR